MTVAHINAADPGTMLTYEELGVVITASSSDTYYSEDLVYHPLFTEEDPCHYEEFLVEVAPTLRPLPTIDRVRDIIAGLDFPLDPG